MSHEVIEGTHMWDTHKGYILAFFSMLHTTYSKDCCIALVMVWISFPGGSPNVPQRLGWNVLVRMTCTLEVQIQEQVLVLFGELWSGFFLCDFRFISRGQRYFVAICVIVSDLCSDQVWLTFMPFLSRFSLSSQQCCYQGFTFPCRQPTTSNRI